MQALTGDMIRIGIVGTFDVENFGDLLFPLIAQRELERRLGPVEVRPYSYHARSTPSWPFDVTPLEQLPHDLGSLNLLLVGGGDIIRFDPLVALNYRPASPRIHHPTGFWLAPILLAHAARVPVAWNAPGLPGRVPSWATALVRSCLAVSAYVSVRDIESQETLRAVAPHVPVDVVPDTAFNAASLLPDIARQETDKYVVVQSRAKTLRWLRAHPFGPATSFVVTPIGPAIGDLVHPPGPLPPGTVFRKYLNPLPLLALIAGSHGVVGTSLHLTIAALSLGRPVFRPQAAPLRKYQILERLDLTSPDSGQLSEIHGKLSAHWDRIASLAAAPAHQGQPPQWEPRLMELWQSVPASLERRSAAEKLRNALRAGRVQLWAYRYNKFRV